MIKFIIFSISIIVVILYVCIKIRNLYINKIKKIIHNKAMNYCICIRSICCENCMFYKYTYYRNRRFCTIYKKAMNSAYKCKYFCYMDRCMQCGSRCIYRQHPLETESIKIIDACERLLRCIYCKGFMKSGYCKYFGILRDGHNIACSNFKPVSKCIGTCITCTNIGIKYNLK